MDDMMTTKAYKGLPMEGPIAKWYAKITLKDIHRHQSMAARMLSLTGVIALHPPGVIGRVNKKKEKAQRTL